jgi:hypothetical protein
VLKIIGHIVLLGAINFAALAGDKIVVEPVKGITLFLKIITYDDSYEFDATKTVNVYLPYVRSNASSYEQFRACRTFFDQNKDLKVSGAAVNFIPFRLEDHATRMSELRSSDYNLMIITSLNDDQVMQLLNTKTDFGLRTFSFDPGQISLGVGISIQPEKRKNSILINLAETQREGSQYGAHLLKMCEIYEGNS